MWRYEVAVGATRRYGLRVEDVPEAKLLTVYAAELQLTVDDLVARTGLASGSVRNALAGSRHVTGRGLVASHPSDRVLAKLARTLGIPAAEIERVGRDSAAILMRTEVARANDLSGYSNQELLDEVARRMAQQGR